MNFFKIVVAALALFTIQSAPAADFKIQRWQTKNGVRVVFYPAMEVPILDINLAFAAGSAYDHGHHGLSALTSRMLNQGNAHKTATAVAEALADLGAQYSAELSHDMVTYNLKTLSEKKARDKASKIFSQIISHPDFPKEAFEHEKKQLLMTIRQSQEVPEEIATHQFYKQLYQNHPYAHPVDGTARTVRTLRQNHVLDFYKKYYVAQNAILVLVGALDSSTARELSEQITQDLSLGKPAPKIPVAKSLAQRQQNTRALRKLAEEDEVRGETARRTGVYTPPVHKDSSTGSTRQFASSIEFPKSSTIFFPSSQTVIRIGQLGIDHKSPHYFPLLIGNYILGGGSLVSRLSLEIREHRGLTYGVSSQFSPMPGKGPFLISLSTKKNQTAEALKLTQEILQKFIKEGPTPEELNAAKHYLIGSFPLSLGSNHTIASVLLRMTFYDLPEDYLEHYVSNIQATSAEEVVRAFKQDLNPKDLLLITVGQS